MNITSNPLLSRLKKLIGSLALLACTACTTMSPLQQSAVDSWNKIVQIENKKISKLASEGQLEEYDEVALKDSELELHLESLEAAQGILAKESVEEKDLSKLLTLCEAGVFPTCAELAPGRGEDKETDPEDAWMVAPAEKIMKGLERACPAGGVFACLGVASMLEDDRFDEEFGKAQALRFYKILCDLKVHKQFCDPYAELILKRNDTNLLQEAVDHFKAQCESSELKDTKQKSAYCIKYANALDKQDDKAHAKTIKALLTANCDDSSSESLCALERFASGKPPTDKGANASPKDAASTQQAPAAAAPAAVKPAETPAQTAASAKAAGAQNPAPAEAPAPAAAARATTAAPGAPREAPRDACARLSNGSAVRVSVPGYPQKFSAMVLSTGAGRASVRVMHPTAPQGVSGRSLTVTCQSLVRAQ